MKSAGKPRVLVVYNRDFEGTEADPENCARADVRETAAAVVGALERGPFSPEALGLDDDLAGAIDAVAELRPDAVFNLCESISGVSSFEPLLPLLLEHAGIAYTGSGPLTLGLAVNKHKAKDILRGAGVPTPEAAVLVGHDVSGVRLAFPLIVKPVREDASVGISSGSVVHDSVALERQVAFVVDKYRQPALVERFVAGREIYVSMLGRLGGGADVLPLHEIDFSEMPSDRPRIVSFEGKWVETSPEFRGTRPVPCVGLGLDVVGRITEIAHAAFAAMELRDYARLDLRLAEDGTPYVIDVNPNCDLSEGAGFARAARAAGLGYDDLIQRVVELALERRPNADTIPLAVRSRRRRRVQPDGDLQGERGRAVRDRAARRRVRSV